MRGRRVLEAGGKEVGDSRAGRTECVNELVRWKLDAYKIQGAKETELKRRSLTALARAVRGPSVLSDARESSPKAGFSFF